MRIIGGSARGRRLDAPRGLDTRPTPGRVREALFSILADHVPRAAVVDLFAGTGALGLEALSRGAAQATLVESSRRTAAYLRRNAAALAPAHVEILVMPARRAMALLAADGRRFDLAFLDPPFDRHLLQPALCSLVDHALLRAGAVVVCEHRSSCARPQTPPGCEWLETRRFGDVSVSLYETHN